MSWNSSSKNSNTIAFHISDILGCVSQSNYSRIITNRVQWNLWTYLGLEVNSSFRLFLWTRSTDSLNISVICSLFKQASHTSLESEQKIHFWVNYSFKSVHFSPFPTLLVSTDNMAAHIKTQSKWQKCKTSSNVKVQGAKSQTDRLLFDRI